MLTQIYTVASPDEARAIAAIGVDHIGTLVGPGELARELPLAAAAKIAAAIPQPTKFVALFLTANVPLIEAWARELRPAILHLGAGPDTHRPADVAALKNKLPGCSIMRSVAVGGEESIAIARSYDKIADYLLLDSFRPSDGKFGALG